MDSTFPVSEFYLSRDVQVQYEVKENGTKSLKWYKGKITALKLGLGSEAFARISFTGTESFEATSEEFRILSNSILGQGSLQFPFRFLVGHEDDRPLQQSNEIGLNNGDSVHSKFVAIERRLANLETSTMKNSSTVRQHMSGLINNSFSKFLNTTRRLPSSTVDEIGTSKMEISLDCTLADFHAFRRLLQTVCGVSESSELQSNLLPDSLLFPVLSFKKFCDLFCVTMRDYNNLLMVKKNNRQGSIVFLKGIGSLVHVKDNPGLPQILSIGGTALSWCEDNKLFYREHGHKVNNGTFAAGFKQIRSESVLNEVLSKHGHVKCNDLYFKWSLNKSPTICHLTTADSTVFGKLVASVPIVTFADMTTAASIYSTLDRTDDYDSESDDSDW